MHMHFFPLYLHICESLWIKCDQPRSNSHPCLPPHLSSCNLSLSPIHLPLTQPLCPCHFSPSFNDLAITGAAVPALVSQGVRGLIGTEWVWVRLLWGLIDTGWDLGAAPAPIEMYSERVFTHNHPLRMHVCSKTELCLILTPLPLNESKPSTCFDLVKYVNVCFRLNIAQLPPSALQQYFKLRATANLKTISVKRLYFYSSNTRAGLRASRY